MSPLITEVSGNNLVEKKMYGSREPHSVRRIFYGVAGARRCFAGVDRRRSMVEVLSEKKTATEEEGSRPLLSIDRDLSGLAARQ